jgi:hypothetical protein
MSSYKTSIKRCDATVRAVGSGKSYGPKRKKKFLEAAQTAVEAAQCRVARWSQPDTPKKKKTPKPKASPKKKAAKASKSKGKRPVRRFVYS